MFVSNLYYFMKLKININIDFVLNLGVCVDKVLAIIVYRSKVNIDHILLVDSANNVAIYVPVGFITKNDNTNLCMEFQAVQSRGQESLV